MGTGETPGTRGEGGCVLAEDRPPEDQPCPRPGLHVRHRDCEETHSCCQAGLWALLWRPEPAEATEILAGQAQHNSDSCVHTLGGVPEVSVTLTSAHRGSRLPVQPPSPAGSLAWTHTVPGLTPALPQTRPWHQDCRRSRPGMFRPGSVPAGPRGGHNGAVHTPGELNTKDSRFLFLQKPSTNFS